MSRSRPRWDPDWICPLCCITIHGSKSSCIKCKTPKLKKGDWVCQCRTFNFADKTICIKCQLPKPTYCICKEPSFYILGRGLDPAYLKGNLCSRCYCEDGKSDWTCGCRAHRSTSELECTKCRVKKPDWCICVNPDFSIPRSQNSEGNICFHCNLPDRGRNWTCQCGQFNYGSKKICIKCQTEKARVCDCDNPKFSQRTTIQGKVVECGPCLNCQKSSDPIRKIPEEPKPKRRDQVKELEDRITELEQETVEWKKRFAELEARLARLESQ